jgi:nucleoside-diphosphate-sugar epimerase
MNMPATAPRSVLVTGATGFIGSHLVNRLLDLNISVTVITRPNRKVDDELLSRGVSVLEDTGSVAQLTTAVTAVSPDVVFHLATNFIGVHKPTDVNALVESNIAFGTRLAEACAVIDDVKFVNVGTVWQHHDARPYGPTSLYSATKQAFQDIVQFYAEVHGLDVVNLELADTYGPHDPRKKLVQLLMETASSNGKLEMSPGEQLINLVHVDDALDALLIAPAHASTEAPSFSVPSNQPLNLKQLVELVGSVVGKPVDVVFGAREYRPREMMTSWQYAPVLPDWTAKTVLADGLADLWASLQAQA